jgi:hypothetical protein
MHDSYIPQESVLIPGIEYIVYMENFPSVYI